MKQTLFLLVFILGCEGVEEKRSGESRDGRPDAESWDATITLTNEGAKRAVIRAGHLENYDERQYILLDQNVDADFFNAEEVYTTNLKSKIAEIEEDRDYMIAIGDVVVVSDSGVTLFTDTLSWDNVREKVFTDDRVVFITEDQDTLYGIGFESDVELNNWKILKPTGVFHEDEDEIVGLLGPNGAGKTTTFYMITGMIKPTKGNIFLDEKNITERAMYQRSRSGIGYLSQEPSIFGKLTVEDNLRLVLEMTNLSKEAQAEKVEKLLEDLSIQHIRKNKGSNLSGGERRRVEISRTLAIDPDFILLDEPFAGVDPIAVEDIQSIVHSLKERDIGVLITDHNVRETLSITDRSYLLFDGKILKSGTSEFLANDEEARRLYLGERFTL